MQEANGKTGAAGRRGALKGPKTWREWERKDGDVGEDDRRKKGLEDERWTGLVTSCVFCVQPGVSTGTHLWCVEMY